MKVLLRILAISAVIFIGVAMVQEWEVFAAAYFGYKPEAVSYTHLTLPTTPYV